MKLSRRLTQSRAFQLVLGFAAAEWLRFTHFTSRVTVEPPDLYTSVRPHFPIIVTMWHGQHFMTPFINRGAPDKKTKV